MNTDNYPPSPIVDSYDFIKPSSEFRSSVRGVIFAIILFFLFYVMLIAVSAAVMVAAVLAGIALISTKPSFITLAIGAGIIALGIMLFVFLFKFIFSRTKNENPFRVQINASEHPELFEFIRKLTVDTQTKFPKKIYLSPDVNAMVFYNSSFWSLFFPVRKNLEIGLGLVNSLNVSEFKSVLAHEFGHFSQRSMKVGSYIYTVNRVIYNLVYEYDNWDNTLSRWAQTGGIFGFFAGVTFWLVERVRSLLKVAYNLINVSYMKLSREMEYHADLVAVSVSGNESFKNALRKIEFSAFTYEYTSGYLNALASKEKASVNLYQNHAFTTNFLASHNKISIKDGSPHISDNDIENSVVKSRINIEDQWASHPTLKERELSISKVTVKAEVNNESAWTIFTDAENLKRETTKNLYSIGFPNIEFAPLEPSEYQDYVHNEINKHKISEVYNGFYEDRFLSPLNFDELVNASSSKSFEELYSKKNVEKIRRLQSNKIDVEVLGQIHFKQIKIKYFEFDGKKYKRKEAGQLMKSLKAEVEADDQAVKQLDQEAFIYHYQIAKKANKERELTDLYQSYFMARDTLELFDDITLKLQSFTNALYSKPRWTEDEINQLAAELTTLEKQFKNFLGDQELQVLTEFMVSEEQKETLKKYATTGDYYVRSTGLDEEAFVNFSNLVQDVAGSLGIRYGNALKKMTDFQSEFK